MQTAARAPATAVCKLSGYEIKEPPPKEKQSPLNVQQRFAMMK